MNGEEKPIRPDQIEFASVDGRVHASPVFYPTRKMSKLENGKVHTGTRYDLHNVSFHHVHLHHVASTTHPLFYVSDSNIKPSVTCPSAMSPRPLCNPSPCDPTP
jgi:hypothetical protein